MTILRWWWVFGLLTGCAELAPIPVPPDPRTAAWAARQALLLPRQEFALSGRIAVQREAEGGHAKLAWQQWGPRFDIRLIAPLSQGSFRLTGDETAVTLAAPNGETYRAADLDALMTTHLKWSLPVAGARFWILGLPVPGHEVSQLSLDDKGRLSDLAQDGWRISVTEYQTVAGLDLPRRLFMLGATLRLRLVITEWLNVPQ